MFLGCRDSDKTPSQIDSSSVPGAIDVDSSDQLYFVDRITLAIWKIGLDQAERNYTWQIVKGQDGTKQFFARWLAMGRLSGNDVLFSSGTLLPGSDNPSFPALVALSTEKVNLGVVLGSFVSYFRNDILAVYGSLTGPRAMDSLTVNAAAGISRVFLIDEIPGGDEGDETFGGIKVFDFDYNETTPIQSVFSPQYTISSPGGTPCSDSFIKPYGLAVDPDANALYVVDRSRNKLFRFSGIDGQAPSCDGEISFWGTPEEYLNDPNGVVVLSGQTPLTDNIIYVADTGNARVVAFKWSGNAFTHVDTLSVPFSDPFDLAIDTAGNLWGSFPEDGRVEIIKK